MSPEAIIYGEGEIRFQLIRRKDLSGKVRIHVDHEGNVLVDSPADASIEHVRNAVRRRARWVADHLREIERRRQDLLPRQYVSGESHFYLGRRYLLKVLDAELDKKSNRSQQHVKLIRGQLRVTTFDRKPDHVKRLLKNWYRDHAHIQFEARISKLVERAPWVKQQPPLRLLSMKKHWGSCSPKGSIVLNPHLVKAPANCIEYVVLHELCHMKEHNHSDKFWRLMSRVQPDWESSKNQLDDMAEILLNE